MTNFDMTLYEMAVRQRLDSSASRFALRPRRVREQAELLKAAINVMAADWYCHNQIFADPRLEQQKEGYGLKDVVCAHQTMNLNRDYGHGHWSLLSDKPARPFVKAAALETLDA